jgi:glutamyl-tRNA reductase
MQRLFLLGLNHTTAPLDVREKLAFNVPQAREAMNAFRNRFAESEAVLLSTCNRVELYVARAVHGHPRVDEMVEFLSTFHNFPADRFRPHLYEKLERDVVAHLFTVVSSLDSMVLGETQILGQVRSAYDAAREAAAAGGILNPLFQRALSVGKQVMTQTALNEGRVSVASVAIDYARKIFDHFNDKTVLSIGAGEIAQLVLQHFTKLAPGQLMVCNRDPQKAHDLASEFNGTSAAFEQLAECLTKADIVITSTGASYPIITRQAFEPLLKQRRYRPIFIIDLAVPRDVEASVGELENVYLYNVDDLQHVVSKTQSQRTDAVESARAIVAQQVDDFLAWHRTRQMGPAIDRLYKRYHALAQEELNRTLNKLPQISDPEREHLAELTRRIVNKLLHDPITALRSGGDQHTSVASYLHALEKLFALNEDDASDVLKKNAPKQE